MEELSGQGIFRKLSILADAAKYDVACTSSGADRKGKKGALGNAAAAGICHSFASDGRCISLLKILLSNDCAYDCLYCKSRRSNDVARATFTPEEICLITTEFYRRNYIEGLFLSSGVLKDQGYTMERIYTTLYLLRERWHFNGYIHVKAIPGADEELIRRCGFYADRMSCNLELSTGDSLRTLAPNKTREMILKPIRQIQTHIRENKEELALYRHAPRFVPAGQSTQVMVGATQDTDYQILSVAESLYRRFSLKRVFYSAYIPVNQDERLPAICTPPPLLREHRLYQADWLLRYYGFRADELLSPFHSSLDIRMDPKCDWALRHLELFPVEVNKVSYETLLRVPGIGVTSARRICRARKMAALNFDHLKKLGVVLKRAVYFITCSGRMMYPMQLTEKCIEEGLLDTPRQMPADIRFQKGSWHQLSLFEDMGVGR